jgi:prepilin-type processing-associated H-X9-DG protein
MLLPYLEQQSLAAQLRFDLPCWHPLNAQAVRTQLEVFINPGAPNQGPTMEVKSSSGSVMAVFGRSHYVANVGQDEPWGYDPPLADWSKIANGPFYRNSRVRSAEVTDGMSNTVFVGEHTTISEKTWVGVVPGSMAAPIDPNRFPFTDPDRAATYVLCHSGPAADEPGIIHPPSFPTCHVCQVYGPWSAPGGNVLFGDGSVRFISTGINLNAWAALSSMNAGDVPSEY